MVATNRSLIFEGSEVNSFFVWFRLLHGNGKPMIEHLINNEMRGYSFQRDNNDNFIVKSGFFTSLPKVILAIKLNTPIKDYKFRDFLKTLVIKYYKNVYKKPEVKPLP